ncbi:MAG: LemA family protein [Acidaminococcaceae bacterium]|uniref:LemA family protein n=1 Tax=Succiniclasticum sp. TaxID=2775030 RepID=UPI001AFE2CE1|nr:LemA family protein [Succiniclasticum sp.]MBO5589937.1 LemA family protein [Acidaminococcaceae bacterium]MBO5637066.1 LemA family protein [Acidaminococcaceae bacterium]MBP3812647.1 LemA family protein [Acidaminococcaceae bacterium]MBR1494920.1 LemA family protein [Acidaminococcaceae bacterium]MBR1660937.1 LemA family protein [Acidaminococcaceae bacterium]
MSALISIIMVVVLAVGSMFGFYNGMVSSRENVDSKWSQVDNQLQRRSDLIPNLVNTVKGYASHEKEVFQAVSDARAKMAGAQSVGDKLAANGELSGALSRLLAVAENYPQLKADQNFRQLQDELSGTENRIAVARKDYNDAVQNYNTKIKSLPYSLFAGALGFTARDYFKVEETAKAVPKVQF